MLSKFTRETEQSCWGAGVINPTLLVSPLFPFHVPTCLPRTLEVSSCRQVSCLGLQKLRSCNRPHISYAPVLVLLSSYLPRDYLLCKQIQILICSCFLEHHSCFWHSNMNFCSRHRQTSGRNKLGLNLVPNIPDYTQQPKKMSKCQLLSAGGWESGLLDFEDPWTG